MQTLGIYCKPNSVPAMDALLAGCKVVGLRPIYRNPAPFTPDQIEPFDLVAVYGLRGVSKDIADAYNAKGIPCLVVEVGHLCRPEGFMQIGVNSLNFTPPGRIPDDRLAILGIKPPKARKRAVKGAPVLILGQVPDDAQHGKTASGIREWVEQVCSDVKGRRVIYRPHPGANVPIDGIAYQDPTAVEIQDAVKGAFVVVAGNSSAAIYALIAGVPVFYDPEWLPCNYSEAANPLPYKSRATFNIKKTKGVLSKISYTNWHPDEIAAGEPLKLYLEWCKHGTDD